MTDKISSMSEMYVAASTAEELFVAEEIIGHVLDYDDNHHIFGDNERIELEEAVELLAGIRERIDGEISSVIEEEV